MALVTSSVRINERGRWTARKDNAFADSVGWQRQNKTGR